MTTLHEAIGALLGVCDGAVALDGAGFNAFDAGYARSLYSRPEEMWTEETRFAAWEMLHKYQRQLARMGIPFESLPAPAKPAEEVTEKKVKSTFKNLIRLAGEEIEMVFGYHPDVVALIKEIPGRRFNGEAKTWMVKLTEEGKKGVKEFMARVREFAAFEVSEAVQTALVTEAKTAPAKPARRVEFNGKAFEIVSLYDPAVVAAVKELPGRKFEATKKIWTVPFSALVAVPLKAFVGQFGFVVSERAEAALQEMLAAQKANLEGSRAADAEIEVEGLGGTLRPFQKAGVAYAAQNKRCFIGDEMGLGKTIQGLATIQKLGAYPALIVCPASLKFNWAREAGVWLPGKKVTVMGAKKAIPANEADVVILNYDVLKKFKEELLGIAFKAAIFDESHYLKNHKAQRTKFAKELVKNIPARLMLTGTPVLNRPQELLSQLGILGRLEELGGFWNFAKRYCGAYQDRFGWNLGGASNLEELNEKMRLTCFIRRTKDQVLTELPPKTHTTLPVEIDNRGEYNKAEKDLIAYLQEKLPANFKDLSEEERKAKISEKINAAQTAEHLVKIEALKQLAVKGKLAAVKEWVASFLETDEKLVLFASHIEAQKMLLEAFPGSARVFGEDNAETRQANVDRFQTDPECKLIVCSLMAAGVGLTLTAASNVAFVELGWNPGTMDQASDRVHRIGQKKAVTAWYLLGSGTIDEKIADLIAQKRAIVNAATEGGIAADDNGIMADLFSSLLE